MSAFEDKVQMSSFVNDVRLDPRIFLESMPGDFLSGCFVLAGTVMQATPPCGIGPLLNGASFLSERNPILFLDRLVDSELPAR
jgi:hypothetical protein